MKNIKPLASNPGICVPDGGVINSFAYEITAENTITFYGDYVSPDGNSIKADAALTIITKENLENDLRSFFNATWKSWELKEKAWPINKGRE